MLILMVRYVFMYWILLGGGTGEHLREDDMPDGEFYRLSACTAKCMQRRQQALASQSTHFRDCYDLCKSGNASAPMPPAHLRQIQENYSLKLICRDDRSLTFRINLEQSSAIAIETEAATDAEAVTQSSGDMATVAAGAGAWEAATDAIKTRQAVAVASHRNETLYLIKVYSSKDIILYLSDDNFFTIPNLQANAVHNITAVAVHASYEYSVIAKEQPYETLARGYTPSMVTNIQVKDFSVDEVNDMRLVARLTWKPSADMTCHYNIICFAPKDLEYDMSPLEIRNPRQLYSYNLDNLTFSSVYKVGIRAKNPNNGSKESALLWKTFQAPSCVEWYHYNFNICPPFQPDGLEVERIYVRENVYSFNVSWQLPQYLPDYYTLHILDIADGGDSYFFNVSKELNAFFVHEVTICGVLYEVHLTAYTPGGNATAVNTQFNTKLIVVPDKTHHFVKWIAAILAPIFCFAILSLTTFIICHRRAKLKRYQERCKYFEELEKKAPIDPKATFDFPTKSLPLLTSPEDLTQFQLDLEDKIFFNDAMEIDHNDVTLYEVLGEGAFGLVRRGIYNDNKLGAREVAVKMLKDQPSIDDVRAFRREIEVMKSVEKHSNIVGIIGHCTKRYNEMMLLTEYCSFGNLLDFLRDEWKYLYEMNMKRSTAHSMPRMHNNRRHRPASRHLEWHSAPQTPHQPQHKNNNNNNNTNNYNSISHINSNGGVGVFNIDATIIEKLKMKYRNLSALQQKRPPTSVATLCGPQMDSASTECVSPATTSSTTTMVTIATPPPPPTPLYSPALATDNKSYGYDAICSNTCKCRLGLVIENFDPRDSNANSGNAEQRERQPSGDAPPLPTKVPQCECQQLRLAKKNRKNTATITDMQQQQQQQQQELSVGHRSCFKRLPDVGSFEVALRQRQWQRRNARAARNQEEANNGSSNGSSNVSSLNGSSKALSASIRREPLSAADLVDIARQVAVGMEFLAKNKVVHRDLAARNVLVAPDRTIKIADFGLSRDIYQENVYKKTGNGKLPIKWLALESMTHQVYTTQSDVWSYGILLYEIVTLGGTPYPSIPTNRLLHLLKTGYRMEKPKNCGQEFYNLMYACWNVNPAERPTFAEIIQILENLLADAPHQQIESVLGVTTKSQSEQSQQQQQQQHGADVELTTVNTDDSYLKPL